MSDKYFGKLKKIEQELYNLMHKNKKYKLHRCYEHGLYARRIDTNDTTCPYCQKEGDQYE